MDEAVIIPAVVAEIRFEPGREPKISLHGMPEEKFRDAMAIYAELLAQRKIPGSESLPRVSEMIGDEKTKVDRAAVAIPKRLPPLQGTWFIEQNQNGPRFKKTDVPLIACAYAAVNYLAGLIKPEPEPAPTVN